MGKERSIDGISRGGRSMSIKEPSRTNKIPQ